MKKTRNEEKEKLHHSDEKETRRLAERYKVAYVDLSNFTFNRDLVQSFPVDFLYRSNFIPLEENGNVVKIAIADPSDIAKIDSIESYLGKKVEVFAASKNTIQEALRKSETALQVLKSATEGYIVQVVDKEGLEHEDSISVEKLADQDGSIIKLINSIIFTAVQKRASDVHIESREEGLTIKFRIDGVLSEAMEPIDKRFQSPIISRIKVMSDLDISERRIPQDGKFRLRIKDKTIDFRVSIMPSIYGEDAVIRILDKEMITEAISGLRMDLLGFSAAVLEKFRKYILKPYGMILVTGPTGSGKTTTLYAALTEIKSPEDKIITIEDPVEYQIDGITQIPVNEKKGLTFARGLRSILRHDPDIIMVGEIRDLETVEIAIQASLTGHLVFSTLHTNDAAGALTRLVEMGVEPFLIASSLLAVVAQRLVRTICPHCKEAFKPDESTLKDLGLSEDQIFYRGKGCKKCMDTGYRGRAGIFELLVLNNEIRDLVKSSSDSVTIKQAAMRKGMTTLFEDGLKKVQAGITTLNEVMRVSQE